jgi:hypothetical protein
LRNKRLTLGAGFAVEDRQNGRPKQASNLGVLRSLTGTIITRGDHMKKPMMAALLLAGLCLPGWTAFGQETDYPFGVNPLKVPDVETQSPSELNNSSIVSVT